jgi:bifunctional DNA-binding transcriptional regulator/antitoxin component of YhaV-PrlF toxin-antitoxin module
MNHNKFGLKNGDEVLLDNTSKVIIEELGDSYSVVHSSDGDNKQSWTVMTLRLSPVEQLPIPK